MIVKPAQAWFDLVWILESPRELWKNIHSAEATTPESLIEVILKLNHNFTEV